MIIKYLLYSICALLSTKEGFGLPTGVELLANLRNSDFFYDLGKAIPTKSGNNTIRQLSVSQFATLAYTGISYTLFELAPCGINLPHIHPRASELLYVISAENLQLGFVGKSRIFIKLIYEHVSFKKQFIIFRREFR